MTEANISHLPVIQAALHPRRTTSPAANAVLTQEHDGVMVPTGPQKSLAPRCMAISHATDQRCKRAAVKGASVCAVHTPGVNNHAPATRAQANVRLAALVEPAITVLTKIMADDTARNSDRIKAADSLLDRAGMGRHIGWVDDAASAKDVLIEKLLEMASTRPEPATVIQVMDADIVDDDD